MPRERESKARCPKCHSNNLTLIEHYDHTRSWIQDNGIVDIDDGFPSVGSVTRISGECLDCGHEWKFRCLQISNLVKGFLD